MPTQVLETLLARSVILTVLFFGLLLELGRVNGGQACPNPDCDYREMTNPCAGYTLWISRSVPFGVRLLQPQPWIIREIY